LLKNTQNFLVVEKSSRFKKNENMKSDLVILGVQKLKTGLNCYQNTIKFAPKMGQKITKSGKKH